MRVAIFGSAGLLGRALAERCRAAGDEVFCFDHAQCDIRDAGQVSAALASAVPRVVFNAAAATDVDRCERDPGYAAVNSAGPAVLAAATKAVGARLVHISTDYVFSGEKGSPYDERDRPDPISAYGRSKLEGERAVLAADAANVVARTAWLYGPGGKSFVARIPSILREKGEIAAISDQRSSPTCAKEAAALLREIAQRAAGGLYHVVNTGSASYYDLAREAAFLLGIDSSRVRPQPSSAVLRPARRPRATPLVSIALVAEGFSPLRDWREAYREFAGAISPVSF